VVFYNKLLLGVVDMVDMVDTVDMVDIMVDMVDMADTDMVDTVDMVDMVDMVDGDGDGNCINIRIGNDKQSCFHQSSDSFIL